MERNNLELRQSLRDFASNAHVKTTFGARTEEFCQICVEVGKGGHKESCCVPVWLSRETTLEECKAAVSMCTGAGDSYRALLHFSRLQLVLLIEHENVDVFIALQQVLANWSELLPKSLIAPKGKVTTALGAPVLRPTPIATKAEIDDD